MCICEGKPYVLGRWWDAGFVACTHLSAVPTMGLPRGKIRSCSPQETRWSRLGDCPDRRGLEWPRCKQRSACDPASSALGRLSVVCRVCLSVPHPSCLFGPVPPSGAHTIPSSGKENCALPFSGTEPELGSPSSLSEVLVAGGDCGWPFCCQRLK